MLEKPPGRKWGNSMDGYGGPSYQPGEAVKIPSLRGSKPGQPLFSGVILDDFWKTYTRYYRVKVTYTDLTGKEQTTTISVRADRIQLVSTVESAITEESEIQE